MVSGDATAVCGQSIDGLCSIKLKKDEPFKVPAGTIHRLTSKSGGVIVEIMFGTYEEEDIERFEDVYGRI